MHPFLILLIRLIDALAACLRCVCYVILCTPTVFYLLYDRLVLWMSRIPGAAVVVFLAAEHNREAAPSESLAPIFCVCVLNKHFRDPN